MKESQRITIRLPDALQKQLEEFAMQAEVSASVVARQALEAYLADSATSSGSASKRRLLSPPDAIASRVQEFMGWAGGDLRKIRERIYLELLALSYSCKKLYPLTPGMLEGYLELRQAGRYFGINDPV